QDSLITVVDPEGLLWLLTKQGILFHYEAGVWAPIATPEAFQNEGCTALSIAGDGTVWIARRNELWTVKGGRFHRAGFGADFSGIEAIHPSSKDAAWVRQGQAYRHLDRSGKWNTQALDSGMEWVQSAKVDEDDTLWLGEMGGGLLKLTVDGEMHRYRAGEGIASNRISSLQIDCEGSLWMGFFDGGLQQARSRSFEALRAKEGAPLAPTSITEEPGRGVWIAGHGGSLVRWDGAQSWPIAFAGNALPIQTRVVFCDQSKRLWAGTFGQGLWRRNGEVMERFLPVEPALKDPRALFQDSRGRLWIGTDSGAFYLQGDTLSRVQLPFLEQPKVCAFAESRGGDIWIGTEGAGVQCWSEGQLTAALKIPESLNAATIIMLFVDDRDALWIGARDAGLYCWRGGALVAVTAQHGLAAESLLAMCDDGNGHFWFTSRRGILRIAKEELPQAHPDDHECNDHTRADERGALAGSGPLGWCAVRCRCTRRQGVA
ncbi:MAG: hypothetical protein EOP84_25470, partial [Verrucomicrobiaceae bacterium]